MRRSSSCWPKRWPSERSSFASASPRPLPRRRRSSRGSSRLLTRNGVYTAKQEVVAPEAEATPSKTEATSGKTEATSDKTEASPSEATSGKTEASPAESSNEPSAAPFKASGQGIFMDGMMTLAANPKFQAAMRNYEEKQQLLAEKVAEREELLRKCVAEAIAKATEKLAWIKQAADAERRLHSQGKH
eukprot:TRINITY_DN2846_c0_g1_i1.p1 TRINITY_DN2846_c0_g1~~TRINITY_DN2846_c0_g1_i1.p1  ORF type:complete len:188 (-),score=29.36 TRINITY_DN2846_c0_g1_i1:71-634(-)